MSTDSVSSQDSKRGRFSSRNVFILAAIGSAVGLGNIWRFPYVAYENGGGSFVIPYLIALLLTGITFLWLSYAIGHKYRGSAPLSLARLGRGAEGIGWWQVLICVVIAIYYAAVIAWALRYTLFSFGRQWGDDPQTFFLSDFLNIAEAPAVTFDVVPGVLIPLLIVWVLIGVILALGVQKGVGATAAIFMPLLVITFGLLVVRSVFLTGAGEGLNALFTPNWSLLANPSVWSAAFGQIFFSLSIGFGIMITYASYVHRSTDMTGSGLVVGFSNSGFELLAGIGVFSVLGFMAQAQGVEVSEVASAGVGLAFIAFPAILNEAPLGSLLGVMFFGSLVMAGFTSQISIVEVVVSAVRDKFEMTRRNAVLAVVIPAAIVSIIGFSTTSALYVLDTMDHWVNQFGILPAALVMIIVVAWVYRKLPTLAKHLNKTGSIILARGWQIAIGVASPIVLAYILIVQVMTDIETPYEDYPTWLLIGFGWAMAIALPVVGYLIPLIPWRKGTSVNIHGEEPFESLDEDHVSHHGQGHNTSTTQEGGSQS